MRVLLLLSLAVLGLVLTRQSAHAQEAEIRAFYEQVAKFKTMPELVAFLNKKNLEATDNRHRCDTISRVAAEKDSIAAFYVWVKPESNVSPIVYEIRTFYSNEKIHTTHIENQSFSILRFRPSVRYTTDTLVYHGGNDLSQLVDDFNKKNNTSFSNRQFILQFGREGAFGHGEEDNRGNVSRAMCLVYPYVYELRRWARQRKNFPDSDIYSNQNTRFGRIKNSSISTLKNYLHSPSKTIQLFAAMGLLYLKQEGGDFSQDILARIDEIKAQSPTIETAEGDVYATQAFDEVVASLDKYFGRNNDPLYMLHWRADPR